jgi:hypothetical protein
MGCIMAGGRTAPLLSATGAAALLALAAWWLLEEPKPEASATAAGRASAPMPEQRTLAIQAPSTGPTHPLPTQGSAAPAADAAAQLANAEVCGISSQVPLSMAEPQTSLIDRLPSHLGTQAVEAARQQFLHALEGGDARMRATAALLREEGATRLAAASQGSRDAALLAWAMQRCPETGCDAALAARWVELEPHNLAAWLSLADALPQRRAQALEQAANASRFELHRPALLATLLRALPAALPPHVRHALMQEVLSAEAALASPALHTLEIDCARAASNTPGLSPQRCAAMAAVLRSSDTLNAGWAGLRMARAQGLPAQEFQAAREALTAIAAGPGLLAHAPHPLGCEAIERFGDWLHQRAAGGEAAAARWLDQTRARPGPTAGTKAGTPP